METDLLRSFQTLVRARSFTAAAAQLGYVQSTVTAQVQSLERQLQARLLDRLPGGVVATEAGRRLLAHAEQILTLEERMRADVPEQAGAVSGIVRLGAPESLCAYPLPAEITALRTQEPGVRLVLTATGTDSALQALRSGDLDVALVLDTDVVAADLTVRRLHAEPLALVGPAGRERSDRVDWSDLCEVDVLLLEEGCSYSDLTARQLAAAGHPATRRSRFGSVETVKRCVAAGLGLSVLPQVTVERETTDGSLIVIAGPMLPATTTMLVTHPARTPTPAVETTLRLLDDCESTRVEPEFLQRKGIDDAGVGEPRVPLARP